MQGRRSANTRAFRPRAASGKSLARAPAGYARARDLPLAARAHIGGREARSGQTASEAPQPPKLADEQTTAKNGPELTWPWVFDARLTAASSGANAKALLG